MAAAFVAISYTLRYVDLNAIDINDPGQTLDILINTIRKAYLIHAPVVYHVISPITNKKCYSLTFQELEAMGMHQRHIIPEMVAALSHQDMLACARSILLHQNTFI